MTGRVALQRPRVFGAPPGPHPEGHAHLSDRAKHAQRARHAMEASFGALLVPRQA